MKTPKIILTLNEECKECSGEGYYEVGPDCNKPASMCCGGCYKRFECDNCGGSGEFYVDFTDWDLAEALELIRDGQPEAGVQHILEIIDNARI